MQDYSKKSQVVVLAGGFGTRLKSVLNGKPKPLADVNGKPFLYFILKNWIDKGYTEFVFSLFFESNQIITFLEKEKDDLLMNCKINCLVEPEALGTGGAISYLNSKNALKDTFIVINADTWIEKNFENIDNYNNNVIGLVQVEDTQRYGTVELDNNNIIKNFSEKSIVKTKGLINSGVYKLEKILFDEWNGSGYSLEKELFPKLVNSKSLSGLFLESNFIDIGVPEDYLKFCRLNK